MLLRRKMDPSAGLREVRERVVRLLTAVVTISSVEWQSARRSNGEEEAGQTNIMFEDDNLVAVP